MRASIFQGRLEANILLGDGETFVVNQAYQHQLNPVSSHVIYPASNVTTNGDGNCGVDHHHSHAFDPTQRGNLYTSGAAKWRSPPTEAPADSGRARYRRGAGGDPNKFTCVMALVADHRFYVSMAESNEITTAAMIISYVEAANQIFQVGRVVCFPRRMLSLNCMHALEHERQPSFINPLSNGACRRFDHATFGCDI